MDHTVLPTGSGIVTDLENNTPNAAEYSVTSRTLRPISFITDIYRSHTHPKVKVSQPSATLQLM